MDPKLLDALNYGAAWMLGKFANLPVTLNGTEISAETLAGAEAFQKEFGDLYPGLEPGDYFGWVLIFQQAWDAKTPNQLAAMGMHLQRIFERQGLPSREFGEMPRPALVVDFGTGGLSIRLGKESPLLDYLAFWLLSNHHKLALCANAECPHPRYVKGHSRQIFCSIACAGPAREHKKKLWWKRNRQHFLKKWKRQRAAKATKGRRKRARLRRAASTAR